MLTRCGDDLFSIAVGATPEAQALAEHLRTAATWIDVVPGIDSVLVHFDAARQSGAEAEELIRSLLASRVEAPETPGELVEIPVVYGGEYGPDLEGLCTDIGMSAAELIVLHTGCEYRVDMIGFTPGFAFVGGLDDRLRVPRRKEPRQRVEAGSVGIADGRTGLYAMPSPGGWTLIGRTPYTLFDPQSDQPFALHAGMRVRFKAISADEFDTWQS